MHRFRFPPGVILVSLVVAAVVATGVVASIASSSRQADEGDLAFARVAGQDADGAIRRQLVLVLRRIDRSALFDAEADQHVERQSSSRSSGTSASAPAPPA